MLNTVNIYYSIPYQSRFYLKEITLLLICLSRLLDLSLVWFKQHSSTKPESKTKTRKQTKASNVKKDETNQEKPVQTCDIYRDGCKTIMSILVILTNDCGS